MKVLTVIQARTGSSRLPGKVLMKINEKSILEYIVEFLKLSKFTDQIIIATTTLPDDDRIEVLAKKLSIDCFRGSDSDVLKRFYECSKFFNGEIIVRITADDPLIDVDILDSVIKSCIETKFDLVSTGITPSFPYGYFIEAFPFSVLKKLHESNLDLSLREHVTLYIKKHPDKFKIKEVLSTKEFERPNWRLSIDYMEDFELISKIMSNLYKPGSFVKYESIVKFLDSNKESLKINRGKNEV
jgi:spore coat polysaccharide biosynthesis protein SpsF